MGFREAFGTIFPTGTATKSQREQGNTFELQKLKVSALPLGHACLGFRVKGRSVSHRGSLKHWSFRADARVSQPLSCGIRIPPDSIRSLLRVPQRGGFTGLYSLCSFASHPLPASQITSPLLVQRGEVCNQRAAHQPEARGQGGRSSE